MSLSDFSPAISFAGCGTLNFYQTGVASTLQEYGFGASMVFAGASAGSGLSVMLAQGISANQIAQIAIEILKPYQNRNILTSPKILIHFADHFLQHFIDSTTTRKIENRVYISITSINIVS